VSGDLYFEIRSGYRQLASSEFEKNIGKDRQCMPAFHNTTNRLQGIEKEITLNLYWIHCLLFLRIANKHRPTLWAFAVDRLQSREQRIRFPGKAGEPVVDELWVDHR
jgi:hypothetical protein